MINASTESEKVFLHKQWDKNLFKYPVNNGSITMMPKPLGNQQLAPYVEYLKSKEINILVSLLQYHEVSSYGLVNEGFECEANGIEFINLQIKDHDVPQFFLPFNQLAEKLVSDIKKGKNIAIHCYAGIGRTGLLTASILMKLGDQIDEALMSLSKARGIRMPETIQQITWLHRYADDLMINNS